MVEGGFIGESQRHANSMGGTMRGLAGQDSRANALWAGKDEIQKLANALHITEALKDQAGRWYQLAMNHNFIQGRRMRTVAAVSLYLTCRRQRENTLMLIDLAEKIQVNVWSLGDTYKSFLRVLGAKDPAQLIGHTGDFDISNLMLKYCRKLGKSSKTHPMLALSTNN